MTAAGPRSWPPAQDEEEPADPDLEDPPLDWDELDAAVAEAREITAAEARDRAYAARMVFGGGWGAVGAAPGRRGPGQPGSAASFPGEHASPAAGFGSAVMRWIPRRAARCWREFADAVAGPDDRYPGATDDEIVGVICAWARAEAHAAARKLAAVAELIRRRPAEDCVPQNPAPDPAKDATAEGRAPQAPAKGAAPKDSAPQRSRRRTPRRRTPAIEGAASRPAVPGTASPKKAAAQMPEAWDEFAVDELSCALGESRAAAEDLLDLAHGLAARLPGTMAALRDGILSQAKADIISQATSALDPGEAAAAEHLVLGRAARLTRPGLRAAIARAVMEVAPKKARKRREEEARKTRVERWMEGSGNAGLAGRELPTAQVLAADQRVTAWAKELRAAGLDGDMDVLRATAYLDILLGMDSRPAAPSAALARPDADPPDAEPPPANPWDYRPPGRAPVPGRVRGPAEPDRPAGHRARPGRPAGRGRPAGSHRPLAGPRPGPRRRRKPEDHVVRHGHRRATATPSATAAAGQHPKTPENAERNRRSRARPAATTRPAARPARRP